MAKNLTVQEVYDTLKNINPKTVVIFNHGIGDGTKRQVFPSDIINGEMCAPPIEGHNPWRTVEGTKYYLPYEYEPCSQQRGKHTMGLGIFLAQPGLPLAPVRASPPAGHCQPSSFTNGSELPTTAGPATSCFPVRQITSAYSARTISNNWLSLAKC